jgi:hypothetical protein
VNLQVLKNLKHEIAFRDLEVYKTVGDLIRRVLGHSLCRYVAGCWLNISAVARDIINVTMWETPV